MTPRQVVATAVAVFSLVSVVLGAAAAIAVGLPLRDLVLLPALLAFAGAGWLLAMKRPDNVVGLLVLTSALGFMMIPWSVICSWAIRHGMPGAATVLSVGQTAFVFDVGGLALLLPLFFPDGRLPSGRRRWRLIVAADIGYMFFALFNIFVPQTVGLAGGGHISSPVAITSLKGLWSALIACSAPLFAVGITGSLCALGSRWRSAGAERRAQMKWVVLTLVLAPPAFVLHDYAETVSNIAMTVILPLVPISIAVSVLRYRLYDIDRIVSRTVGYVLVTGVLVGVYVGCVALTTKLLPFSSSFGVAASTLAAAAAFQPVRRRVQGAVDRRFNRARYDAPRTIDAFAIRLREEVDADLVRSDLMQVVSRSMQPKHVSLWVAS